MTESKSAQAKKIRESDLYAPVKALLLSQGYEVKGEIKGCDVLARRDDILIAVEMKLTVNLTLVLQANDRAASVDYVYIAIPADNAFFKKNRKALLKLLRKLACGLIIVGSRYKKAEAILDPGAYVPRQQKKKRARLLKEFEELVGDPNKGGSATGVRRVTAYRQKAVHIARLLQQEGDSRARDVRDALQIDNARDIMYQNHYGWFEGAGKGVYRLSERGTRELSDWSKVPEFTRPLTPQQ